MSRPNDFQTTPDESLLADYLADRCDPAERQQVAQWIDAKPGRGEGLVAVRYAASYPTTRSTPGEIARLRDNFWTQVHEEERERAKTVSQTRRRWLGYLMGATAIAMLALPTVRVVSNRFALTAPISEMKEYRTAAGQRARVVLPDSSTIILAPASRIRYAADFGSSSDRTVTLEGQALFTVTHAAGAPFTVRTGDIVTRVLGTSFAVRRYPADTAVQVIVAQGKVGVAQAVLTTGDVAVVTGEQEATVSRANAVTQHLAWTEGKLVFSNTLLRDVIPELERWYGITVQVTDPALLNRPVLTTLDTRTASRAIELVAFAVDGHSEFLGTRAVIHSR